MSQRQRSDLRSKRAEESGGKLSKTTNMAGDKPITTLAALVIAVLSRRRKETTEQRLLIAEVVVANAAERVLDCFEFR